MYLQLQHCVQSFGRWWSTDGSCGVTDGKCRLTRGCRGHGSGCLREKGRRGPQIPGGGWTRSQCEPPPSYKVKTRGLGGLEGGLAGGRGGYWGLAGGGGGAVLHQFTITAHAAFSVSEGAEWGKEKAESKTPHGPARHTNGTTVSTPAPPGPGCPPRAQQRTPEPAAAAAAPRRAGSGSCRWSTQSWCTRTAIGPAPSPAPPFRPWTADRFPATGHSEATAPWQRLKEDYANPSTFLRPWRALEAGGMAGWRLIRWDRFRNPSAPHSPSRPDRHSRASPGCICP